MHHGPIQISRHPHPRTFPATRTGLVEHARVCAGTTAEEKSGSLVRRTEESDRAASLALAETEVRAGAVLPGSGSPEHQATRAVPQPTDNPSSASHHLAELREETRQALLAAEKTEKDALLTHFSTPTGVYTCNRLVTSVTAMFHQ